MPVRAVLKPSGSFKELYDSFMFPHLKHALLQHQQRCSKVHLSSSVSSFVECFSFLQFVYYERYVVRIFVLHRILPLRKISQDQRLQPPVGRKWLAWLERMIIALTERGSELKDTLGKNWQRMRKKVKKKSTEYLGTLYSYIHSIKRYWIV